MTLKITKEEARARGREAADQLLAGDVRARIENDFTWTRNAYLGVQDIDLGAELTKFAEERMTSALDLTKYPECRGLREIVKAERDGFAEVCEDPFLAAYHFDWYWFVSRRLNARFVGTNPPPAECTDFWFADSKEGGPIHGSNRDDVLFRYGEGFQESNTLESGPPEQTITVITCVGGASAACYCDDEPECLFPVNLDWIMPEEITDLREYMGFLERYREFWGPGNRIYVDPDMNFAAVEKANVRLGVRYSTGCSAITACAYLTPEMNAFKEECDKRSFEARGWPEDDNSDKRFWEGCERRYRRLVGLVEAEYQRGATLIGAAAIALDHAVPFPDRVCVAGERSHPDEKMQNWTMISFAKCISGPNRRMLLWVIDPTEPKPIYTTPCHVVPGEGLEERQAEWETEVREAGEIGLRQPG